MKLGILTQPLYTNYGGLVQCYALQTVLQRMEHETIVLQREFDRQYTFRGGCIYYAKHLVKMLLGRRESWHYVVPQEKRDYIAKNTYRFIEKNINPRSEHIYSSEQLAEAVDSFHLNAEDLGYEYITASTKEKFLHQVGRFLNPEIGDKPMIFEVFTESQDGSESIKIMRTFLTGSKTVIKQKIEGPSVQY